MAKVAARKRQDIENELMVHVDSISDPKVQQFIREKKEAKLAAKREAQERSGPRKTGVWAKEVEMSSSSEDEEMAVAQPIMEKIKAKKVAPKAISKKK